MCRYGTSRRQRLDVVVVVVGVIVVFAVTTKSAGFVYCSSLLVRLHVFRSTRPADKGERRCRGDVGG